MSEKNLPFLNKTAHPPYRVTMEAIRKKVVVEVLDGFL